MAPTQTRRLFSTVCSQRWIGCSLEIGVDGRLYSFGIVSSKRPFWDRNNIYAAVTMAVLNAFKNESKENVNFIKLFIFYELPPVIRSENVPRP